MSKNRSEVFGQFRYADSLTYEELLTIEDALIAALQEILQKSGAVHLDFTPLGDELSVQCVFETQQLDLFRAVASVIAALLPQGVTGRLVFLDKSLAGLHVFWMQRGLWQEEERAVPVDPPAGLENHAVDCVELLPPEETEAEDAADAEETPQEPAEEDAAGPASEPRPL